MLEYQALSGPLIQPGLNSIVGNKAYGFWANTPKEAADKWAEFPYHVTQGISVWLIQDGQPMWIVQRVGLEEP